MVGGGQNAQLICISCWRTLSPLGLNTSFLIWTCIGLNMPCRQCVSRYLTFCLRWFGIWCERLALGALGKMFGTVGEVFIEMGLAITDAITDDKVLTGAVGVGIFISCGPTSSFVIFCGEYWVEIDSQSGMYILGASVFMCGKMDLTASCNSLWATVFPELSPLCSAPAMIPSKCLKSGISDLRVSVSASFSVSSLVPSSFSASSSFTISVACSFLISSSSFLSSLVIVAEHSFLVSSLFFILSSRLLAA